VVRGRGARAGVASGAPPGRHEERTYKLLGLRVVGGDVVEIAVASRAREDTGR